MPVVIGILRTCAAGVKQRVLDGREHRGPPRSVREGTLLALRPTFFVPGIG